MEQRILNFVVKTDTFINTTIKATSVFNKSIGAACLQKIRLSCEKKRRRKHFVFKHNSCCLFRKQVLTVT